MVNYSEEPIELASIPMVLEFFDIFPKILPRTPLPREVEFTTDVTPRTKLISKVPYRIASVKLKELKVQLEEMLEARFICPSKSPWGALVLFVKKNDGFLHLCIDYRQLN